MKIKLILILSIFVLVLGCKAQQLASESKEFTNNIERQLHFKGVFEPVDSLLNNDFEPIKPRLQTSKNQNEIEQLLLGTWTADFQTRINGKDKQTIDSIELSFFSNYSFWEVTQGDTLKGEFLVEVDSINNLVLIYDEPQYPNLKEMLENMTEEELEQISYQVRLINIFEIEEKNILFFYVLPIVDYTNPGLITHSRLVLENYSKK